MLRKNGIFARMFAVTLASMLIIVCVFAFVLAQGMNDSARRSYEREVTMQAREVASLLDYMQRLSIIRSNNTVLYMLQEKTEYINDTYQADIWLVSYEDESVQVQYLDNNLNTSYAMFSDAVNEQLHTVAEGKEIRVQGLFPELGEQIVTIGVPWTYSDGSVVGAVLLHISVDDLRVDYSGLIGKIALFVAIAVVLACAMSFLAARTQAEPIRKINEAMKAFGAGNYDSRAVVKQGGEIGELADSYNRMAQEIAETETSRRAFVAAVSHELRSPLTCMRGYVQGMLDGTIEGDNVKKYLRVVMDESVRLTDLVRDLLDLSRLESGKFPMEIAPFDICELVRRTVIMFEKRFEDKNAELDLAIPDDAVSVMGDMKRVSQVVSNLTDNSLKYGGNRIAIRVEKDKDKVTLTVHDDGEGISPEDLPHIFDRFYKADKAHTSGQGTGLGLSISRRIIEQHGSSLTCESGEGKGTSFTFSLPLAEET